MVWPSSTAFARQNHLPGWLLPHRPETTPLHFGTAAPAQLRDALRLHRVDPSPFTLRRSSGRRRPHSYTTLTAATRPFSRFPFARRCLRYADGARGGRTPPCFRITLSRRHRSRHGARRSWRGAAGCSSVDADTVAPVDCVLHRLAALTERLFRRPARSLVSSAALPLLPNQDRDWHRAGLAADSVRSAPSTTSLEAAQHLLRRSSLPSPRVLCLPLTGAASLPHLLPGWSDRRRKSAGRAREAAPPRLPQDPSPPSRLCRRCGGCAESLRVAPIPLNRRGGGAVQVPLPLPPSPPHLQPLTARLQPL